MDPDVCCQAQGVILNLPEKQTKQGRCLGATLITAIGAV